MPTALKAAAAMVQALQAKGYDQDMAKIALEQVAYADVEQAAALLNEWSGGAPAEVAATVRLRLLSPVIVPLS